MDESPCTVKKQNAPVHAKNQSACYIHCTTRQSSTNKYLYHSLVLNILLLKAVKALSKPATIVAIKSTLSVLSIITI